jgi:hypothetical protein
VFRSAPRELRRVEIVRVEEKFHGPNEPVLVAQSRVALSRGREVRRETFINVDAVFSATMQLTWPVSTP